MGTTLLGIAAIIGALTSAYVAIKTQQVNANKTEVVLKDIKDVQQKLETNNGMTVGQMTQNVHSLAAQQVPEADRSPEEIEAVALLTPQQHATHAAQIINKGTDKEVTSKEEPEPE